MDYLPISKVNTVVYCPRRFYFEQVLGEVSRNHHLIEGQNLHQRAYTERNERSDVLVWSDDLGLLGVIDRLERRAGSITILEYKKGRAFAEANHSDAVQLAAQALCLAASRQQTATEGAVYYHASHSRREVVFDQALFAAVYKAVALMRQLLQASQPPAVAVSKQKCSGCSVIDACQPELWRNKKPMAEADR
jgi:CRISPR-associated exonuclease Cas4